MPVSADGDIFKSLNKAQCRAVSSENPTVAILAGPGSGKTHTLTSRVVWLIDHVGIQPCDVLVATFTVKASNEMKTRIGKALGDGREKKIVLGTFHSIARRYLAAYGQRIGLDPKFGIADDTDSRGILQRICKKLDAQVDPALARSYISKRKAKGTSDEQTVKAKNGQNIESKALEQCYQEYQDALDRSALLDYDDLLVRCVQLLREFPSCVSNIQTVLIDEYQDTNGVQYDLMKLFAQKSRRITIVGDPDQSIYGWRSAEIRNLHRLLRDFPGTDEISLEENYRSSSSILDVSLKVIQQDEARYKKVLVPIRNRGTRPVLRKLKSSTDEADWIVSEIRRMRLLSGNMIDFDDVAILLRSASLSRHIESSLGRAGISYRMVGGFKFYERVEIKIVLDYMRVIHQPHNNDALVRIINVPKRGIGDVTIKSLLEEAERGSMSLWDLLNKHCRGEYVARATIRKQTEHKISGELIKLISGLRRRLQPADGTPINLVEVIQNLLRDLQFEKYLEDTYGPEYESRWANVQEFANLAEEFVHQNQVDDEALPPIENVQQGSDDDLLARFLANVSLASEKQTDDKDAEGKPLVTVSTIHAAKGLEWPVVFVPAVYKGSIPHIRSDDMNEERRLLYVAMTRAKALLYLSCPLHSTTYGRESSAELSPFIEGISSSDFRPKGPSFDRPAMEEVARIVQRRLPPNDVIYKEMPPMTAMEDDLYPVDPTKPHVESSLATGGSSRTGVGGFHKRQKVEHNAKRAALQVEKDSVEGWVTPCTTTMERAGSFTVPQAPNTGFTTAGTHLANVTAAKVAEKAAAPKPSVKSQGAVATKRATAVNRPPTQRNLLGFGYGIADHDKSRAPVDQQTRTSSRPGQAAAPYFPRKRGRAQLPPHHGQSNTNAYPTFASISKGPQPAVIEPELTAHKISSGRSMMGKPVSRRGDVEMADAKPQYPCFSSSSPSKPSPEKASTAVRLGGEGSLDLEKENVVPQEEKTRPAQSFHATTVKGPMALMGGGLGGIKRPAALGRSGISRMERLNKPYKLTVKRP